MRREESDAIERESLRQRLTEKGDPGARPQGTAGCYHSFIYARRSHFPIGTALCAPVYGTVCCTTIHHATLSVYLPTLHRCLAVLVQYSMYIVQTEIAAATAGQAACRPRMLIGPFWRSPRAQPRVRYSALGETRHGKHKSRACSRAPRPD